MFSYFYCRAVPVWPRYFLTDTQRKWNEEFFKKKKKKKESSSCTNLGHSHDLSELSWVTLGAVSQSRLPCWLKHTQERARQGRRKRRRSRRHKPSWLLFTFFRNGLLEGCQKSPGHRVDFWGGPCICALERLPARLVVFSVTLGAFEQGWLWFISGGAIGKIKQSARRTP